MNLIDNRFVAREEGWGTILQDIKNDRIWALKKDCRIERFKDKLYWILFLNNDNNLELIRRKIFGFFSI